MPPIASLDHLVLTVADIDRTVDFYVRVLGTEARRFTGADGAERIALHFGEQKINMHLEGREIEPNAAATTPGSADLCFLTSDTIPEWEAHLRAEGVEVLQGPVPRSGATGPILSLYFRDPDGNLIEVSVPVERG